MNYNLGMVSSILIGILGLLLFLFVFWKRLKDDYSSDIIFQSAFSIFIGLSLGLVASRLLAEKWFFWMALGGSAAGMLLMINKFKLRFFETLEAFLLASLPLTTLMFFADSVKNVSSTSFFAFIAVLVISFFAYWVDVHYKGFSWYKSGRIGFTGLSLAAVFFLTRTVVAILGFDVVSFVGIYERYVSGAFFIISLGTLIRLANK